MFSDSGLPQRLLILQADRLYAETLVRIVRDIFPAAEVGAAWLLADARRELSLSRIDLLLAGATLPDGETADLLATHGEALPSPLRTLIVTGSRQSRVLKRLHALPIAGIFDSSHEGVGALEAALRRVAAGYTYWSGSALECINASSNRAQCACRALSLTEQLVLAAIGDGSDDAAASERLGFTRSSIQSVRRSLHRRLGVQHKGELIRIAAQCDFVRFTAEGVVRPGFAQLLAAWQARRRRRRITSNK